MLSWEKIPILLCYQDIRIASYLQRYTLKEAHIWCLKWNLYVETKTLYIDNSIEAKLAPLLQNTQIIVLPVYSPCGNFFAASFGDGRIRIWDYQKKKQLSNIRPSESVGKLTFSPDSKTLVYIVEHMDDFVNAGVWQWQQQKNFHLQGVGDEDGSKCFIAPTIKQLLILVTSKI